MEKTEKGIEISGKKKESKGIERTRSIELNKIYQGDALEVLKTFPDQSINMLMTSPPYWALRDYDVEGQLGLEPTFDKFIINLCNIFDEVKRVLRDDGTIWINLGDTYYGGNKAGNFPEDWDSIQMGNKGSLSVDGTKFKNMDYPSKSLCMIPQRFAIEMIKRGWLLRNTIIWHKPNCMPSSIKDRFTVDFEYLFFFSKKRKYYFETQHEPVQQSSIDRMGRKWGGSKHERLGVYDNLQQEIKPEERMDKKRWCPEEGRNKRCVWKIPPKSFKESHFAVYPEELCETPIKAGCPEFICKKCGNPKVKELIPTEEYSKFLGKGWHDHENDSSMGMGQQTRGFSSRKGNVNGIKKYKDVEPNPTCDCNAGFDCGVVLDPFFGAGTTGLVALKQRKKFVGIELNSDYIKIAEKRLKPHLEQRRLI